MARVVDEDGRFRVFSAEEPFDDLEWRIIDIPLAAEAALNGPFSDNGGELILQSLWLESEPESLRGSLDETQLLLTGIAAVTASGETSIDDAIYAEFESQQGFGFRQTEADYAAQRFFSQVPIGASPPTDADIAASPLSRPGEAVLWSVPDRIRVEAVPHLARSPEQLGFVIDGEASRIAGLGLGEETLFGVAAARIEGVVVGRVELVPTMDDRRYEGLMITHRDGLRQWVSGEPSWSLSGTIARTLEPEELWVAADDPNAALSALLSQLEEEPSEVVTAAGVSADFSSRPIQVGLVSILFIGTGAGVALAIAGVTGYVVEAVRRRHREMGVLRALGFRRSGVAGTFALEQVVVLGLGAFIGIAAGIGLMRLMIPFLQLGEEGADLVPPALLQVPMGRLAIYLGVVGALLMISVLFITRSVSARKLSEVLREVEG
jgi:hypothetical protein